MNRIFFIILIALLCLNISGCSNPQLPTQSNQSQNEGRELNRPRFLPDENNLVVPNDSYSIQTAIDSSKNGDIVTIGPGIYKEALRIEDKNIKLVGVGKVTIAPPTDSLSNDVIYVQNSQVSLVGLRLDATVCGSGIYANSNTEDSNVILTILDNEIFGFWKNGITINGPNTSSTIMRNNIFETDSVTFTPKVQSAIQIGFGAHATCRDNYIDGNSEYDSTAVGILVFESSGNNIINNSINAYDLGIAVQSWGMYLPTANSNLITNNNITNCTRGISVSAYDWEYSLEDSFTNFNKIGLNTLLNKTSNGLVGIELFTYDKGDHSPEILNNRYVRNQIEGYNIPIDFNGISLERVHLQIRE